MAAQRASRFRARAAANYIVGIKEMVRAFTGEALLLR
jgi:hypothetical protein